MYTHFHNYFSFRLCFLIKCKHLLFFFMYVVSWALSLAFVVKWAAILKTKEARSNQQGVSAIWPIKIQLHQSTTERGNKWEGSPHANWLTLTLTLVLFMCSVHGFSTCSSEMITSELLKRQNCVSRVYILNSDHL